MKLSEMRQWLNQQSVVGWVIGVLLIGFALYYAVTSWNADTTARADFYDEDAGKPVMRSIVEVPPLKGANGNLSVVRAYYFGNVDARDRKLAYLEKYTPEMKQQLEAYRGGPVAGPPPSIGGKGLLVRRPAAGSPWVAYDSPEGERIRSGI